MICNLEETLDGNWIVFYVENEAQVSQSFTSNEEAASFYSLKMQTFPN
jgi:hypothetical protein